MEYDKLWRIQIVQAFAELNHASCRFCKENTAKLRMGPKVPLQSNQLQRKQFEKTYTKIHFQSLLHMAGLNICARNTFP